MKKMIIMAAMLLATLPFVQAQDTNKVSIKLYGFIRNYLTFDSRKTYSVVGGEYNMQPYDELWNEDHSEDLNDIASLRLQALTSRFGVDVTGPRIWGWNSSAKLEGDFGGFGTNNTVLRLRLAYIKLGKQNSQLVFGQDWHPLSGDIMPEVLGMAAGAPFRPHSRTPQVRTINYWGSFGCTVALLYQLQYMNNGPVWDNSKNDYVSSNSTDFANNALLPEAFIGFNFKQGAWYTQLGVDAQMLRPRNYANVGGVYQKVNETVESFTPTLYAQYVADKWSIKFRTLLAENTSHLNQLCGYAVTGVNDDGSWNYAPIRNSISYFNIAYGKKVRANLFFGYMKNLGAGEELYVFDADPDVVKYRIYMKGGENFINLNSIYRIAPSISFNTKLFNVGIEYEWTAATYGDILSDGAVSDNANLHQVSNHRICALVKYNF